MTPPSVAEIVTGVLAETSTVDTVKVAEVAEPDTAADCGTDATAGLLLASATEPPAAGAGAERCTVPVEPFVPFVVAGFMVQGGRNRGRVELEWRRHARARSSTP